MAAKKKRIVRNKLTNFLNLGLVSQKKIARLVYVQLKLLKVHDGVNSVVSSLGTLDTGATAPQVILEHGRLQPDRTVARLVGAALKEGVDIDS